MVGATDILSGHILIVDSEPAHVALLEGMLRKAGYASLSTTKAPSHVCELHRKNRYALILLPLPLPGLDGGQVMEGLKTLESGCYLPVIAITDDPRQKLLALEAGAQDVISRSLGEAEVLLRVRNVLAVRLLHLEGEQRALQAEGRFIESQKLDAIGHLAAGVAHDFNNIIAIVIGYSELLMEQMGLKAELRCHLEAIRSAGERAAGLTRQLLIFSRKQKVELVVLDLNDVVNDLDGILQPLMHENIKVSLVLEKQLGRLRADSGYIGQVLINLVVNARDAMPQGGLLTISTSNATQDENKARNHAGVTAGDYVMLSVSDTGTGMTDEVKAHLFEAMFTTKPKGAGTGLGLVTCLTIVQQFGGHIEVASELGAGTTFRVYLPRVDQPVEAAARRNRIGLAPRGSETLLVVEDDPGVRLLTRGILEAHGYKVLTASNGVDALSAAREHSGLPIGLVLTDVIMPLMGGKVMAEWLKTAHPNLKVLFTSGYTDDAISHYGVLEPGVEFLAKPYTPSALAHRVRELLDQPSATLPDPALKPLELKT